MNHKKRKTICTCECPNCLNTINIIKETEVLEKAVPANKRERYIAEKSKQTTLPLPED